MRLDIYLAETGLVSSRSEAKRLINEGAVMSGGEVLTKPALDISGIEESITVVKTSNFASRGGVKLEAALDYFGIECVGKLCLDIGASTGGFTDCLLTRGASYVIAVDTGSGQLIKRLACDPRVTSMENYNARYMKPSDFPYTPNLAVMDVSFISATYLIEPLSHVLPSGAEFVCLIKPQFEVGKSGLSKGGIVRNERLREEAKKKVVSFAEESGFLSLGLITSPIKGGDGNTEYLAYFKRK